jgi:deoxyhypusine synthase
MGFKESYMPEPLNNGQKKKKKEILKNRISPVDFESIKDVGDLVESFGSASIQARNLGKCAKIFGKMLQDEENPTIILGLAGPLIAAGLRKVIRDMVHYNMVDVIVSTGAILYQDYYNALGGGHYYGSPDVDDAQLRDLFIDRIYDTYVDDELFVEDDTLVGRFADTLKPGNYSSRDFIYQLSETIDDEESILFTARKNNVPVFSPAINDSSLGIGLTEHYYQARKDGRTPITIDSIRDNYELTQLVVNSTRTAAFYVAGGVPKNYINDSVVMAYIFGKETGGHKYALQVTTDSPHWGGLSGSTFAEAQSWGKINKEATHSMAFIEPSVSLPLIYGYAFQKGLYRERPRLDIEWKGDTLKKITRRPVSHD